MRNSGLSKRLFRLALMALVAGLLWASADQSRDVTSLKAAVRAAQAAAGEPLHYYCGDFRVELIWAYDELFVSAPGGAAPDARLKALVPGAKLVSDGCRAGQCVVRLASKPDAASRDANARALADAGYTVHAVAYPYSAFRDSAKSRLSHGRKVITDQITVQLRPGVAIDAILAAFPVSVAETVAFAPRAYVLDVLRDGDDSLVAAIHVANAMRDSGQCVFASPVVLSRKEYRLIPNDPMFSNQWHLRNTGSSPGGAVSGNDVNVIGAWDEVTGEGVNIAIVDDGVEQNHEDLLVNMRTDLGIDVADSDSDPAPGPGDDHGTAVAGVAGAVGGNSVGVAGAAFQASLIGVRLAPTNLTSDTQYAAALGYLVNPPVSADRADIYNNSWGPSDDGATIETFPPLTQIAVENGIANGRGGKGSIYVWAAGNGREYDDYVNYDGWASSRYTIAVGATGAEGTYSYYSEPGASMLVNAPSSYYVSAAVNGGITTTDRMGSFGYSSNNYTSDFGGTSSASPLAAGVIALVLDSNPNLTWRDMQHVLVESAVKNNPGNSGWFLNGGARWFNHAYGFGRINAAGAVSKAASWVNLPASATPLLVSELPGTGIPDSDPAGITRTLNLTAPSGFLTEFVEVTVSIMHTYRGDLGVKLTSPQGTTSVLGIPRIFDSEANLTGWMFTSVAHWDEDPSGTWQLNVADHFADDVGTLNSWTLRVHGYLPYTGPVLAVSPVSRALADTAGSTSFSVNNSGSGTLGWSAAISPAASWIAITSGASGTGPGTIALAYNQNTDSEARTATLVVTAAGAGNSPFEAQITQSGKPAPRLSVSPISRSASYAASSVAFDVQNTGDGTMTWSAQTDETWLRVQSPSSGVDTGSFSVEVSTNPYTVSRTGVVTVTAPGALDSPAEVVIVQGANTSGVLSVQPSSRNVANGANSTSFVVQNAGGGIIDWTASVTAGASWLTLNSGSSGQNSGVITVSYQANPVPAQRTATITVTAPGVSGSPATVTVVQDCGVPSPPANVAASDGAFSDRIRVTWNPIEGAIGYAIYRNTSNTFASASLITEVTDASYDDYLGASTKALGDGCAGGQTKYYYWIVTKSVCGNSDPSAPDSGYVGSAKSAQLYRRTYAKAMLGGGDGTQDLVTPGVQPLQGASAPPVFAQAVGAAYRLDAAHPSGKTQTYLVPVPNDAEELVLYCYQSDGSETDWYPAANVEGWLAGPVRFVKEDGRDYAVVETFHGGAVQFGRNAWAETRLAALGLPVSWGQRAEGGAFLLALLPLLLLLGTRRRAQKRDFR